MSAAHSAKHHYSVSVTWTGNRGEGTSSYRAYDRAHEIAVRGKTPIQGSSDPAFSGDSKRWNPEEMLVASLSTCHMLWYLHLCADAGIIVTDYRDEASGTMVVTADGGGRFTEVTLQPAVTVKAGADLQAAVKLHDKAHHLCFIANSVNFTVACKPSVTTRP
ncbi:MAG: OsmC family protein [Planctomycetes bacterium]|nr:OsmC family protein [Planctomycetota bacterium]